MSVVAITSFAPLPADAVIGNASYVTGYQNLNGVFGSWRGRAHFSARWDSTIEHSEGMTYHHFNYVIDYGALEGADGVNCQSIVCSTYTVVFGAFFLNANGGIVQQYTSLANGYCGVPPWWPAGWRNWAKCTSNIDVPISATKIRTTWFVNIYDAMGEPVGTFNATKDTVIND